VPNPAKPDATPPVAASTVARPGLRVYPESPTATGGVIYFDDIMFYDKATMAVSDVNAFDKAVKMNTIVGNELKLILPGKATRASSYPYPS